MTPRLWLLLILFFAIMGGLLYGYVRAMRAVCRMRDEALAALPRLTVTYSTREK